MNFETFKYINKKQKKIITNRASTKIQKPSFQNTIKREIWFLFYVICGCYVTISEIVFLDEPIE